MIGKLIWHQFTTVVILKQIMRQNKPGGPDASLRTALENMRYGACTPADVRFLNSRISRRLTSTDLSLPQFRNVSIITCYNSYKDRYNDLGAVRFAHDTNQTLLSFYSVDTLGGIDDPDAPGRKRKKKGSKRVFLSRALQKLLWSCEPHSSDHIPGKLSLCLGMPVMLHHNDATELCMTKGQEGVVVGWDSKTGCFDTQTLETVYVRLKNPPQKINIPGLPKNTVPVTRSKHRVKCHLPDDTVLNIEREQVNLLPNFSMTDYALQGKTRDYNVVDLSRCKNIQSLYTCLSRSSTAANTVIAHPFDTTKIQKPVTGFLRQEFRETMILDQITALRFKNALPNSVAGDLRYPLVRSFQANKLSLSACMGKWHPSLRYSSADSLLDSDAATYIWDGNLELPNIQPKTLPAVLVANGAVPDAQAKVATKRNGNSKKDLHQPLSVAASKPIVAESKPVSSFIDPNPSKRARVTQHMSGPANDGPIGIK
jgi:hypothetical protein